MSLIAMKELLETAALRNQAVAAINASNMETVLGVIEAAERLEAGIIIQAAPIQLRNQAIDCEQFAGIVRVLLKKRRVKAALHLDHAKSVEDCRIAIDAGFTSVMFDGSMLDFETNKKNTREVVNYAIRRGVTVEAELGCVGGIEGESEADGTHQANMTDPAQVKDFIETTKADCLAVAIGNAHGFYRLAPKLDFERLKQIRVAAGAPLVLHGGTGIPREDLDKSIAAGIRKINFFTEVDREYVKGFLRAYCDNQNIYMMDAQEAGRQSMMREVDAKIKICQRMSNDEKLG